jgi:DNA-directed RNA polymerase subunit M/transcription elongation factor TFIIS
MLCPNCGQQMNVRNVDNEIVLHCSTCGSSFFDKNGINKITQGSARMLTEEAQGQYILGNQKTCPKDKSILLEKVDPTLPKNTILLECPSCEGIFAYPDDLLKYKGIKTAQPLSSGAFKMLPAPKSLFMLASFAVLSIAVLLNTGSFSTNTKATTSAVKGSVYLSLSSNGSFLMVNFVTGAPQISSIIFYDAQKQEKFRSVISATPTTNHSVTIRGLFDKNIHKYYKIIFSDSEEAMAPVKL